MCPLGDRIDALVAAANRPDLPFRLVLGNYSSFSKRLVKRGDRIVTPAGCVYTVSRVRLGEIWADGPALDSSAELLAVRCCEVAVMLPARQCGVQHR